MPAHWRTVCWGLSLLLLATVRAEPPVEGLKRRPAEAAAPVGAPPADAAGVSIRVRGKVVKPSPVEHVPADRRKAVVLVCDGVVDPGLHEWMVKTTNEAIAGGATHIIYEIDTYGGLVKSAIDISEFISKQVNPRVHTAAYVPDKAISAGIMISLACRDIFVGPNAKIGDSAPVAGGGEKIEGVEREKIESMLRAGFRSMAQANGYPEVLCEAMVTGGPAIYRVFNKESGRFEYLRDNELTGKETTHDLAGKKLVLREKQLLTMTAEEAFNYGFAQEVVTVRASAELDDLRRRWEGIKDDSERAKVRARLDELRRAELPTLTAPILAHFGITAPVKVEIAPDRGDFMTSMMVESLNTPFAVGTMLAVGIIGLLIGIKSGEMNVLVVGIGAFVLFFFVKNSTGAAEGWEIFVTIAGVCLIILEVLYFPTMGGLLVVGAVMFLGGMVLCFLPPINIGDYLPGGGSGTTEIAAPFPWAALREAAVTMLAGVSIAVVGTWLILTYMHKIPFLHGTVLAVSQTEVAGAGAAALLSDAVKIGEVGAAESPLRPVGKARFGDRLLDVVAQGDFLARGDRVEVIAADGNRILVRKVD